MAVRFLGQKKTIKFFFGEKPLLMGSFFCGKNLIAGKKNLRDGGEFLRERERRRISHTKRKLRFAPRKLRYPPKKLSFQFLKISAFGDGVIRGRKIELYRYYQQCILTFYTTAFSYNFGGD